MATWKELRQDLQLTDEEEQIIAMEKEIINAMIAIREEQGLSQSELAKKCNVKQPVIARMEKDVHSPQINSLLKILMPLGYTLQVVPYNK